MAPPVRRRAGFALGWLAAVSLAVGVGLVVVTTLGDSLRGRGPIGEATGSADVVAAEAPTGSELATAAPGQRRAFDGRFGKLVVACRGPYAAIVGVTAATGWRVLSYESEPDDDVDAVFARRGHSVEVEVFCNQGRPTLAELEHNELPSGD
jgi:hypothetical protein